MCLAANEDRSQEPWNGFIEKLEPALCRLRCGDLPNSFGRVRNRGLQFFRSDQSPGFAKMESELFIADARKLNANPTAAPDIGWFVEFLGRAFDQRRLDANRRWHHYRQMAVVVMIVRKHRIDLFANEEGGFAVRDLLSRFR